MLIRNKGRASFNTDQGKFNFQSVLLRFYYSCWIIEALLVLQGFTNCLHHPVKNPLTLFFKNLFVAFVVAHRIFSLLALNRE